MENLFYYYNIETHIKSLLLKTFNAYFSILSYAIATNNKRYKKFNIFQWHYNTLIEYPKERCQFSKKRKEKLP